VRARMLVLDGTSWPRGAVRWRATAETIRSARITFTAAPALCSPASRPRPPRARPARLAPALPALWSHGHGAARAAPMTALRHADRAGG
jgi:hypothetical protein